MYSSHPLADRVRAESSLTHIKRMGFLEYKVTASLLNCITYMFIESKTNLLRIIRL